MESVLTALDNRDPVELKKALSTFTHDVQFVTMDQKQVRFLARFLSEHYIEYAAFTVYMLLSGYKCVAHLMKKILRAQAAMKLHATKDWYINAPDHIFYKATIDPRYWFGYLQTQSLHVGKDSIPKVMERILMDELYAQQELNDDGPLEVSLFGRFESQLPLDYTKSLSKRLYEHQIYVDHHETMSEPHPVYGHGFGIE